MKALVIVSHSWSPFFLLVYLYGENKSLEICTVCPFGEFSPKKTPTISRELIWMRHFYKIILVHIVPLDHEDKPSLSSLGSNKVDLLFVLWIQLCTLWLHLVGEMSLDHTLTMWHLASEWTLSFSDYRYWAIIYFWLSNGNFRWLFILDSVWV